MLFRMDLFVFFSEYRYTDLAVEQQRGLGGPNYLGDQSPRGVFLWLIARVP